MSMALTNTTATFLNNPFVKGATRDMTGWVLKSALNMLVQYGVAAVIPEVINRLLTFTQEMSLLPMVRASEISGDSEIQRREKWWHLNSNNLAEKHLLDTISQHNGVSMQEVLSYFKRDNESVEGTLARVLGNYRTYRLVLEFTEKNYEITSVLAGLRKAHLAYVSETEKITLGKLIERLNEGGNAHFEYYVLKERGFGCLFTTRETLYEHLNLLAPATYDEINKKLNDLSELQKDQLLGRLVGISDKNTAIFGMLNTANGVMYDGFISDVVGMNPSLVTKETEIINGLNQLNKEIYKKNQKEIVIKDGQILLEFVKYIVFKEDSMKILYPYINLLENMEDMLLFLEQISSFRHGYVSTGVRSGKDIFLLRKCYEPCDELSYHTTMMQWFDALEKKAEQDF